jgi:hypothetical protein
VTDRLAAERSEQGLPPEHIEDEGVLARLAALVMSIYPLATNAGPASKPGAVNNKGDQPSHVCPSE